MTQRIRGALAPVLTPFTATLEPDTARFIAHCRWLVDNGAGLAVFGTNSEAASLSTTERITLTDALLEAGIPSGRLMPGTGACALPDAVALSRHASAAGAGGLLVLPPFFFKGVTEDGVFGYYAEIIERVGSGCAPVYLYHIPPAHLRPDHTRTHRAPARAVSDRDRRCERLLGRLEQHQGNARPLRGRRLRRLPGERIVPVGGTPSRCRRVHQRDREHESEWHPAID